MPRKKRSVNTPPLEASVICEELYEERLREEAMQYMPSAVKRMAELATSGSGATAQRACEALIAHGHRKPPSRLDDLSAKLGDGKLHVTITLAGGDGGLNLQIPATSAPIDVTPAPVIVEGAEIEDAEVIPYEGEGSEPDPLLKIAIKGLQSAN